MQARPGPARPVHERIRGWLAQVFGQGGRCCYGRPGGGINLFQMILIGRCQSLNDVEVADQPWVLGQRTAGTLQQLGGQRVIAQLGMKIGLEQQQIRVAVAGASIKLAQQALRVADPVVQHQFPPAGTDDQAHCQRRVVCL